MSYCFLAVSLEWVELSVTGALPPPRCGHTATMVEKRLLIYGGRGNLVDKYIIPDRIDESLSVFPSLELYLIPNKSRS